MKHADVKEALDLANEEVSKEPKRIRRIGGERGRRAGERRMTNGSLSSRRWRESV